MRSVLQHSLKMTRASVLVLAAVLIPAASAHAQGRGGGGRQGIGFRAPVGQQVHRSGHNGVWVIMPDYAWGWWSYPNDGVAYSPYGVIRYTPCGYGWTLPYYFTPYSDGFSENW